MNIVRWDPLREMQELSNRFRGLMGDWPERRQGENGGDMFANWAPAVDVSETDAEYLVKADLPEVKKEDVKIGIQDGVLSVEGERKQEKEEKGKRFHRVERSYGKFVRRLALPSDVDSGKIAAEFKDGVLNVHMPKSPAATPKTIDIKVT